MNSDVIGQPDELTPPRLTSILNSAGVLNEGEVQAISSQPASKQGASKTFYLEVSYSADSANPPTGRLLLKISEDQLAFQTHEAVFYDQIVPEMAKNGNAGLPFVPCFHSAYNSPRQQSSFLLANMSASHSPAQDSLPISLAQAQGMVAALASVHGFWWEHKWLGEQLGDYWDALRIERLIQRGARNGRAFLKFANTRLSAIQRDRLAQVTTLWPAERVENLVNRKHWTLVHREAHPSSFLFPNSPESDFTLLTDWHSWRVDTGTDDLAYMIAAHWYPAIRAEYEQRLLREYHERLLSLGVDDYSWGDCCYDYRASIARVLFTLIGGWRRRRDPALYWDRMEKALLAFDDWDCDELF